MFKINSSLLPITFSLLLSTLTFSQDTISITNKDYSLNEIIIQGNRIQLPFSQQNRDIVVIDSKVIETLPVKSLNEILSYVPGVDIRQRSPWGGQADVSINGGSFDQTLVLLNGLKIIDPQTGHNMMNLPISPDAIERIEIMKGAAASAYGINALNGVINIITKQPDASGIIVSVNGGSSFEKDTVKNRLYGGLGMDVTASLAFDKSQHLLSLSTTQSTGYRYNTPMNNNKAYYQNKINLGQQHHLQVMGGFIYNDFGANGFYAAPFDKDSREIIQTGLIGLKGDFKALERWTIRPSVNYRYNHDDYIFVRDHPEIYENNHFTNVIDASINNSIATSIGTVGVGVEYRSEIINSNNLGKWTRDNYGLFAEFSFTRVKNFTANLGAYLNYSKFFNWQLLPSLDLGYQIHSNWRLFANVGTGNRVPTYTDWYYVGPQNIGNSKLKPENALHTEGGIKFNFKELTISTSYFYRLTNDAIDWVKDSLNAPWQPQNFQKINLNGFTFSADYRLIKSKSIKDVSVIAGLSYTWLEPKILRHTGQNAQFSHYTFDNLRNQLIGRVNIGFLKYFNIGITGRFEERVSYKSYILLDASLSGTFADVQISFTFNNLLNVTYIEAGATPLPGRWFNIGVKYQFWKKK
ncbi:MAG: TonB-dependent receptor [Crocinitomicaceae bacterium]|nr:TonB-dependent receptor [Crocinitomicaceae bacterium]